MAVAGTSALKPAFPVPDALAGIIPAGGLLGGSAYSLGTAGALLLALLAEPSGEGNWCGVVGMPELGVEAAERAGVSLDRLVLVPEPGDQWLAVTAALVEVLPVIAIRPGGRFGAGDATRLSARLRDRGGVLLVHGDWPRSEARLEIAEPRWAGVGSGHGCLTEREVLVTATSKRFPERRSVRLELPDRDGRVTMVSAASIPERIGLRAAG